MVLAGGIALMLQVTDAMASSGYPAAVQADSPSAYYRLNETSGTTMHSTTGAAADGVYEGSFTLGGPGALPADTDTSASFAGAFEDGATIPVVPRNDLTLELWVKTTVDTGTDPEGQWFQGLSMLDAEVSGVGNDFGLSLLGGRALFGVGNDDTTIHSATGIADGSWHQVVATRDGAAMRLYVDGALEASIGGPSGARDAPTELFLAKLRNGGTGSTPGNFDEVAVYDHALSAERVAAHYAAASSPLTPPPVNLGVPVSEDSTSHTFTMPRLIAKCKDGKTPAADPCPKNVKQFDFATMKSARKFVASQLQAGANIQLVDEGKSSSSAATPAQTAALRSKGKGGEVLKQSIRPGTQVTTTYSSPVLIEIQYFDTAKEPPPDLGRQVTKSKCDLIARDADKKELLDAIGAPDVDQRTAAKILLKKYGCQSEFKYHDAPGATKAFIKTAALNTKDDLVTLTVAVPVAQDLLLTVREDPQQSSLDSLEIGADGALTASPKSPNVFTVQVNERSTGRFIKGIDVTFVGNEGKLKTQPTDANGETTFRSKLPDSGNFAIVARYADRSGAVLEGYRLIKVVDRKQKRFTTMAGRELSYDEKTKLYSGHDGGDGGLANARALPIVPANLGTGFTEAAIQPPEIVQATVLTVPQDGTSLLGRMNAVSLPNDTSFIVGAAPGLILFGGGTPASLGHPSAAGPLGALAAIVGGANVGVLAGVGTIADYLPPQQKQALTQASNQLLAQGVLAPDTSSVQQQGLGVIATGGGNVIATGGLNVIATGGGNVIATGGLNLIPVKGGNVIAP